MKTWIKKTLNQLVGLDEHLIYLGWLFISLVFMLLYSIIPTVPMLIMFLYSLTITSIVLFFSIIISKIK